MSAIDPSRTCIWFQSQAGTSTQYWLHAVWMGRTGSFLEGLMEA